jgi:hypothetical protein
MALDTYLLPAPPERTRPDTAYGRASFANTPLRELRSTQLKAWYDGLPYGRTAEKLLMIVRAILGFARTRGWLEADPSGSVERQEVRYSGDYDFYSLEEIDALVRAAANEQDAAIFLTALSMMNAATALEARPQPIPWSPRPAMSGATLWTSVSTSVPAAVTASAGERHWPAAEVVRRAGEDDECGHDRDEVGDGGQRQVGMAQPVGSAVQLVQRDRAC